MDTGTTKNNEDQSDTIGQVQLTLVGVLHGITYELLPLPDVAIRNFESERVNLSLQSTKIVGMLRKTWQN